MEAHLRPFTVLHVAFCVYVASGDIVGQPLLHPERWGVLSAYTGGFHVLGDWIWEFCSFIKSENHYFRSNAQDFIENVSDGQSS